MSNASHGCDVHASVQRPTSLQVDWCALVEGSRQLAWELNACSTGQKGNFRRRCGSSAIHLVGLCHCSSLSSFFGSRIGLATVVLDVIDSTGAYCR
mmetsp:Transcript_30199/g.76375  ORF Transcript_30199/g.76375 Transcript_30199/m.76375 type:complete len:96 (+) Transcript_30199:139-426(+)